MPWRPDPPSDAVPRPREVERTAEGVLREGIEQIAAALRRGTPVDTGLMRDSWVIEQDAPLEWRIVNLAPYSPFVRVDTREADRIVADLFDRLTTEIGETFGG